MFFIPKIGDSVYHKASMRFATVHEYDTPSMYTNHIRETYSASDGLKVGVIMIVFDDDKDKPTSSYYADDHYFIHFKSENEKLVFQLTNGERTS